MTLVLLLIVATSLFVGLGLVSLPFRTAERRRLERLVDGTSVPADTRIGDEESLLTRDDRGVMSRLLASFAGRTAADAERNRPVHDRLVRAGYRKPSAVVNYMGSRILLALLLPMIAVPIVSNMQLSQLRQVALVLGASLFGYMFPSYWVSKREQKRQEQIILGLPDALDLMIVCVEAGLGINASLARVANEFALSNPVLSAEFELVTLETRAGKRTTDALRGLAHRTGVGDVSSLVAMLVQTERFGTNLADTLRIQADSMRVQRMQRAEEQAQKAPLKMLFPMVIIFVATLLVTIGPGMMQMFQFFNGDK